MPKKIEHLKGYFITRLFFVMFFILLSESLINMLVFQKLLPVLNEYLGVELFMDSLNSSQRFTLLLHLLLYVGGEAIRSALAPTLSVPVILAMQQGIQKLNPGYVIEIPKESRIPFILAVMVILILYVLPYIVGILVYSRMVIRKVEEIREYDNAQREQFLRRRNLMFSDITHDLKTPITVISGYAQALNEGMVESPERQKEYLDAIYVKSMQMNRMITVLFDYVKLDSESFTLKKEMVDLSELLREIGAETYPEVESAGMELTVNIPDEKCMALLDVPQFSRVITNLLGNAVRHNESGTQIEISLGGSVQDGPLLYGNWKIQISDTGTQIDDTLAEHLFEPFVMGDASRSSKNGSGLGLSVAAKLIAMHGGKITLKQPGEAPYTKAFCVELPKAMVQDDYEYGDVRNVLTCKSTF